MSAESKIELQVQETSAKPSQTQAEKKNSNYHNFPKPVTGLADGVPGVVVVGWSVDKVTM